jgi:hypothetical protein
MVLFAIAFYVNDEGWFIGMSCLGRLLQGGSVGGISTIAFSYCPSIFSDR